MPLPDADPFGRGDVHLIGFCHAEGLIPFGEVAGRHIGAQLTGGVYVIGQKQLDILLPCLSAPNPGPAHEIPLVIRLLKTVHDFQLLIEGLCLWSQPVPKAYDTESLTKCP